MDSIIRVRSGKNFTIIPNDVFKSGLSLRATGLLCYILHLPDDWVLYKTQLYKTMENDGRDAIRTAWSELESAGYIVADIKVGGGRGKVREITYFVYDIPQKRGDFQAPNNRQPNNQQPKDRQPKTRQLLKTKEQSTNHQDSVNTIVLTVPEPDQEPVKEPEAKPKAPTSPAPPPPKKEKEPAGLYPAFIDRYYRWFQEMNDGIPPKIDAAQGKAAKTIIKYLQTVVVKRAEREGVVYLDAERDNRILEAWGMVLDNWGNIEPFYQDKTRLIDINSNLQNILKQVKNGIAKRIEQARNQQGRAGAKIGSSELVGIFNAIDNRSTGGQ